MQEMDMYGSNSYHRKWTQKKCLILKREKNDWSWIPLEPWERASPHQNLLLEKASKLHCWQHLDKVNDGFIQIYSFGNYSAEEKKNI